MTAKMQRLPYITGLVGMFLTITLCISCSHEQSSSSYVRERVEDLKRQTAPSDASVRETAGVAQKGQSVSAQWEFDTSLTREEPHHLCQFVPTDPLGLMGKSPPQWLCSSLRELHFGGGDTSLGGSTRRPSGECCFGETSSGFVLR